MTLTERVPIVLMRLAAEVSWPIVVTAIAGTIVLARRDRPSMLFAVTALAGIVGFSTFFSGQTDGFLQPAFVLLWLLAAVGIDAVARLVAAPPNVTTAVAASSLALVAAWHVSINIDARDLSHDRFAMRYFDALAVQIPAHSGLLAEDFLVDRMVLYERFSGSTFDSRDLVAQVEAVPDRVRELTARGYGLFAFAKNAANLRRDGFDVDFTRWPLEVRSTQRLSRRSTTRIDRRDCRAGDAARHHRVAGGAAARSHRWADSVAVVLERGDCRCGEPWRRRAAGAFPKRSGIGVRRPRTGGRRHERRLTSRHPRGSLLTIGRRSESARGRSSDRGSRWSLSGIRAASSSRRLP
ncbi:MAG: hypothetical protein QM736_02725 [Vicinamibacterales bacterium]